MSDGRINGYDLAELDTRAGSSAGAQIDLRHPGTDQPLGMWVRIMGPDADETQKIARDINRRRREVLAKDRRTERSSEEHVADDIEFLVAVSIAWLLVLDGAEVEFSKARAREVYERFPWIRRQLNLEAYNFANFLPRRSVAASSSSPAESST